MTDQDRFIWHADARLFAGSAEIARPAAAPVPSDLCIPACPTEACLTRLTAQIAARGSFCLRDGAPLTGAEVPATHFVTLTGGSTGQPKAILRSQKSWTASFAQNAAIFGIVPGDSIAVLGRLSHSLALYGVLEGLHLGADVHVLDSLSPRAQIAHCLRHGVRILYATPTQLLRLARAAKGQRLPALRLILCGGGALQATGRAAVRPLAPNAALHVFYGAAETSFITLGGADTPDGAVGAAYPGVTLRILDEAGQSTGGVGEVWVRSPYLFDGYLGAPGAEAHRRDGFVFVGEIGHLDGNGLLWLKGRRTRMITIADQNVYPEEVENFITDLPGVAACAVLPLPDALRGHRLVACLEGARDPRLSAAVTDACRRRFGPLVAPRRVHFLDDLPRLVSGKTDHAELARLLEGGS
ncbi:fatty acid--CoA ligase family protein [Sulfitobacter sp. G21635-S1]|uniref:class I adenylate-forming enzyme family protein n=1 Tax=Sulfitobacter sp. G21635-S1 TaxID=3014043 RepID=UPI0022AF4370|nr:fatty acid--CoA ligase family protein [Sulfitobacter sp. G21635-S1]MCZ4256364.1 fatty acid--CoA ligase family protein [Sulfitobacter sp. G21635-S1]